jgi:hypothetical protein
VETKTNSPLTEKYFSLTNFPNNKQTRESLGNGFPETTFRGTNPAYEYACFPESGFRENTFRSMENTFQSKKNLAWFSGKCFPFILGGKHFLEDVKNLEMSYYLLIISNLVLKLLIDIYIFCFEYLFFNFIP